MSSMFVFYNSGVDSLGVKDAALFIVCLLYGTNLNA